MWPDSLVREIVEKRCVIHVGSGVSCQAKDKDGNRPPSWPSLLTQLKDEVVFDLEAKTLIQEFVSEKRYLDAAEIIRLKGSAAEFGAKVRRLFIEPEYDISLSHQLLVGIAPKIFVTTNYDTLLEGALIAGPGHNSYTQFEHTREGLLDAVRSPSTILVKLHGCAKYPNDIILSRSDYFRLRKKYSFCFDVVSSVYKLHTVLFVGCGIEDPDINLILENNQIQVDARNPSYAMVGSKSYAAKLRETIRSQYNIELITFNQADSDDYSNFVPMLGLLSEQVGAARAKYGISV